MWLGPMMLPLPTGSTGACDQAAYRPPTLSIVIVAKSLPTMHPPLHAKTVDAVHEAPESVDLFTVTWSVLACVRLLNAVWTANTWPVCWLTSMLPAIPSLQSTVTYGSQVSPPSLDLWITKEFELGLVVMSKHVRVTPATTS